MFQERSQQYHPVAYLKKPHGVYGKIEAQGDAMTKYLFDNNDLYWIIDEHNMLVPLRLNDYTPAESGDSSKSETFFVQFDGITSRDAAIPLTNVTLYLELHKLKKRSDDQPHKYIENNRTDDIIDYEIWDQQKNREGVVVDLFESPAHLILVSDTGLMIPFVDEYIVSVDDQNQTIYCRNIAPLKEI